MITIGAHFQRPVTDWPSIMPVIAPGTVIKAVDNVQMLSEAKAHRADCVTLLRHWYDGSQIFGGSIEDYRQRARIFFDSFIDGTFRQHAHNVDYISEWNEYTSHTLSDVERDKRKLWAAAVASIWFDEYRSQVELAHIRLCLGDIAIGNSYDWEWAEIADTYDCALGYHSYIPVHNRTILADEWVNYSGRFAVMDQAFKARGFRVDWLITEFGPVGYSVDDVGRINLHARDGWKHPDVCGGNVDNYKAICQYWIDLAHGWNSINENRLKGVTLYTTGDWDNGQWRHFETRPPVLNEIVALRPVPILPPPPPPPPEPPPGDWQQTLWDESIDNQVIYLNPDAALQQAIFAAGFVPVSSEFSAVIDGTIGVGQAAEHLAGQPRRVYYTYPPDWVGNVDFITDPTSIFEFVQWPTISQVITQAFGANPKYYKQFGLPGHEGVDMRAPHGSPIYAVTAGVVYSVTDERLPANQGGHNYGVHVRIETEAADGTFRHIYCHLDQRIVDVGDTIIAGQTIGYANSTGNSSGSHLHLTLKRDGAQTGTYPAGIIDPTPYLMAL